MNEFKKEIDNFDVVHIHMASYRSTFRKGKYVRIAKTKGKKVIIHIHGAEYKVFYEKCNDKQKEEIREILNLADRLIVLSEEWQEFFETIVDKSKICVIYNSIVIPDNFEKNLDTNKVLFLGRVGQRKGIYDLIDVVERLIPDFPELKLYVGGDGEVDKLKQLIQEKKLEQNVIYVGWTTGEQKEKLLRECSFYILPSYYEGMPMSVLEGMAYKNVVISTKVGGIPKVISNNENGMIIEPGDKETLYKFIVDLLNDSDRRAKLSQNARRTMEDKFDIKSKIEVLYSIYC